MRAWAPILALGLGCGAPVPEKMHQGMPPPKPTCLSGDATRPLLTWARGTDLIDAFADGTTRTAHSFAAGAQVDVLTGANGFLLASAKTAAGREAVLFDATGATRWTQTLSADALPSLGTDGWTTTAGAHPSAIDATGNLYPLQGTPLAHAGMDGWVPTLIQPLGIVALEHPADGTVNSLDAPPAGTAPDVRWAGDRIVYLSPASPAMELISARQASQQQRLSLGSGFEQAHLVSTSGQFVLVESSDGQLLRADVVNQQVHLIASVYPFMWAPLAPTNDVETLALDSDGSVVRGFTNNHTSALFVSSDFGHDWTAIGDAFNTTSGTRRVMSGQHLSDSWVISAFDVDGEVTTLADSMMVNAGTVELIPAGAIGFGAPLDTPVLDAAGSCAAYWKPVGATDPRVATEADLRIHGKGGADVSLSTESVPLTSWSRVVWR